MGENVITINGKRYDAKTGRLLDSSASAKHAAPKPTAKKHNGPSIDGFSRRPAGSHIVAAHAIHKKTERSKTLMRGAVKKPASTKVHSTAAHTSHHKAHAAEPAITLNNHERAARAATVSKSKLISRFGSQPAADSSIKHTSLAHLPVKPAPPITTHGSAPIISRPDTVNPFQNAIDNANSHEQPLHRKASRRHRIARALRVKPRTVSLGSFLLAGMLLGGFFVYQNIPNLAMKVAAARSGVNASLPGYKPAGFALNGPIKYSSGKISISYRSVSDERAYQVTQSTSEWNSETLLENFVAVDRRAYQTYQDKGKTIYIYNDNNATWVDGGVWYQVEGRSSLNSDQLLRIANSL